MSIGEILDLGAVRYLEMLSCVLGIRKRLPDSKPEDDIKSTLLSQAGRLKKDCSNLD